jgi:hypothetical protein
MNVGIFDRPLILVLHGLSGHVEGQDYAGTGQRLMDAMWQEIRAKELKHRGINYWVYEDCETLFVGVELEDPIDDICTLVRREIVVPKYAYWKHIGPYGELGAVRAAMDRELGSRGLQSGYPSIEVYGHWAEDESQLETEIIVATR